jgi:hypothetical protein
MMQGKAWTKPDYEEYNKHLILQCTDVLICQQASRTLREPELHLTEKMRCKKMRR